jgi:hypothetical protein
MEGTGKRHGTAQNVAGHRRLWHFQGQIEAHMVFINDLPYLEILPKLRACTEPCHEETWLADEF